MSSNKKSLEALHQVFSDENATSCFSICFITCYRVNLWTSGYTNLRKTRENVTVPHLL